MRILRARAYSLAIGLFIGCFLGARGTTLLLPEAHAAKGQQTLKKAKQIVKKQQRTRVVVGLKDPLTPPVIEELNKVFRDPKTGKARIINIAPGGAYALVLLVPGETLEQVQAKSSRIAWVEPEVVMGAAQEARSAVVVIPAPRWPKEQTQ